LTRLGQLVDHHKAGPDADAPPLGPFLDETDRIIASLVDRQARLDQERAAPTPRGTGTFELETYRRLWDHIDVEVDRLRASMRRFAEGLTAGELALATRLEGRGAAGAPQPSKSGAGVASNRVAGGGSRFP